MCFLEVELLAGLTFADTMLMHHVISQLLFNFRPYNFFSTASFKA